MRRNVYIVSLNMAPFLPYVYGTLRVAAEADPDVAREYAFPEPFFYNKVRPAEIVDALTEPAVLGLSCYVWNFHKHMKTAALCKQRHPETLVVAGGPHVPDRVDDFFDRHPYVDVLVHGEGEVPFRSILKQNLAEHPDWSLVDGVSFLRDGRVVTTPTRRMQLEGLTRSPYLEGYLDASIEQFRSWQVDYFAPWETNRGCPYSCSFCDWGSSTMSKIRQFDLDRLMAEVDFFAGQRVPLVHINDANFGILGRDTEIARHIAEAREQHGFPREIRVNFAKNSTGRVFDISSEWNGKGLLNATTLSMQATTKTVLEAIARQNIPVKRYQELQHRYTEADIRTYTEVILGLPTETRQTFKSGLDDVLEMGNHDDIRVYHLVLLPNAPVSQPESVARHGLRTVEKELGSLRYPGAPDLPDDEVEYISTVVETNTMSRADWVDCSVYAQLLQVLHAGYYTRYLAMHLHRAYDLPYHVFYDGLQQYFAARPDTVVGRLIAVYRDFYTRFQESAQTPMIDWSAGPRGAQQLFGPRPYMVPDHDWAWLCLAAEQDTWYAELREYLATLGLDLGPELDDLLRYQQDVMLHPDYEPAAGKTCRYEYDFPAYFAAGGDLARQRVRITFRDTATGPAGEFALEAGNPKAFLMAAVPKYSSSISGYYRHRGSVAEIDREPTDLVTAPH